MKKYLIKHSIFFWISQNVTLLLIVFLALYTLLLFAKHTSATDLLFYLIPDFILIGLLELTRRHERLGGTAFMLISFGYLLIYHTYISITIFLLILSIGWLFLKDSEVYQKHTKKKFFA